MADDPENNEENVKPCDDYPDLPCAQSEYCLGPVDYEFRSYRKGERLSLKRSAMMECPWEAQAQERIMKGGLKK